MNLSPETLAYLARLQCLNVLTRDDLAVVVMDAFEFIQADDAWDRFSEFRKDCEIRRDRIREELE